MFSPVPQLTEWPWSSNVTELFPFPTETERLPPPLQGDGVVAVAEAYRNGAVKGGRQLDIDCVVSLQMEVAQQGQANILVILDIDGPALPVERDDAAVIVID